MTQARRRVDHLLPSRGKSLSKTHFPRRRFLHIRTWARCFSDCTGFRLSSCSSCLCFFLYFGLDEDKGRAHFKPRGEEPKCQIGMKAGNSNPGQATRQKQATRAPRKNTPISQGRPSQREELQTKVLGVGKRSGHHSRRKGRKEGGTSDSPECGLQLHLAATTPSHSNVPSAPKQTAMVTGSHH